MTAQAQTSELHFTTEAFAPRERIPAWREVFGAIAQLDFDPAMREPFNGEARMRVYSDLTVGALSMTRVRYSRPRNRGNADDVLVAIMESGRMACTGLGREVYLEPGDAVLGLSVEAVSARSEGTGMAIRVPVTAIAPLVDDIGAGMNRRIQAGADTLRLLRPYVRTLMDCSTTPALQKIATRHVCDLVAMLCGASRDGAEIAKERGLRAARLRAVKTDIVASLAHGDVSVDALALRHHMSPRSLQRLFERDGTTLSEFVLEQRLAHAHRLLCDPRRGADKVASVAFAAGFGDLSYFYKAFRRRYGLLPTDVRTQMH